MYVLLKQKKIVSSLIFPGVNSIIHILNEYILRNIDRVFRKKRSVCLVAVTFGAEKHRLSGAKKVLLCFK
jgi:hypothetical protein